MNRPARPRLHRAGANSLARAIGLSLILATSSVAEGSAPELRKVHALLVIDTKSGLAESVTVDGERVDRLLSNNLPADRVEIRILTGKDVNADAILAYYRALKVGSNDALLFYYAGHGATDPTRGHFLAFQDLKAEPLFRDDLRQAMLSHQPGLVVLLTDCCSNRYVLPGKQRRIISDKGTAKAIHPILRNLLYQSRGVVDITAASGNEAFGDDQDGGIFTRTFSKLVLTPNTWSDQARDGFISWPEFFERVRAETEGTFVTWAHRQRALGQPIKQPSQKPYAYSLASDPGIRLRNESAATLLYQFRWTGEDDWENARIAPKSVNRHAPPPARGEEPARLDIRYEGGKTAELKVGKAYRFHDSR